jgi:peptidoglycan/xylan/chitin deacetylase (PgdA/CDA1 family)
MYHVLGNPSPGTPLTELWVSPASFAAQMRYLDRHGYWAVTLQEVYDYWHGGPLPVKPVVLSFDDGFESDFTVAMPILAAHHWSGTLNLAVSHYRTELGEAMLRKLLDHGWELDSHSLTHAHLPGLARRRLDREVSGSRRFLRSTFHVEVNFFCYPSGAYDADVIRSVRRAGYLGATTTEDGAAGPATPYRMPRVRVSRSDGVSGLARRLSVLTGDGGRS